MSSFVLDASALLAILRCEPGAEVVAPMLSYSIVSCVNYSEVLKKTVEIGGDINSARSFIQRFDVELVDFTEVLATATANLYPQTVTFGLSFADRACIALGMSRQAAIVTADRQWSHLDCGVEILLIR